MAVALAAERRPLKTKFRGEVWRWTAGLGPGLE
jgi:hypothetical protein